MEHKKLTLKYDPELLRVFDFQEGEVIYSAYTDSYFTYLGNYWMPSMLAECSGSLLDLGIPNYILQE